jgi:hypothetical protein
MKIGITLLLVSTIAWASRPAQTPNFFEVDTDITNIRPDKQVAIEHYKNKIKKLDSDRPSQKRPGMNAAEKNMQSSQMVNPAL